MRLLNPMCFAAAALAALVATSAPAADQALIDAAKKEGSVTWYTTLIINQFTRPAAEAFEKKYGIKVEYIRADPNEIALRISNEAKAGKVLADIFDGFGMPALVRAGFVEKWIPDTAKRLPQQFRDPNEYWAAPNIFVLTPGFNTDLVKKGTEPKTFADLLDPKWRGKMVWSSRMSASSAPGFIGAALTEMGDEKGMDYLRKLAEQKIVNVDAAARQLMDQIIAGEYPVGLQMFNHHAVISASQGAPSAWIAMEPATVVLSVLHLTTKSPHPNAGKLLFDFLQSEEGQKLFRDADYMPVDPAVPPRDPTLRPDTGKFKARYFNPDELDAAMPKWQDIYLKMFR